MKKLILFILTFLVLSNFVSAGLDEFGCSDDKNDYALDLYDLINDSSIVLKCCVHHLCL